jgi:hypothetical protein
MRIGNLAPIINRYVKSADTDNMRAGGRAATIIVGLCGMAVVAEARRIPGKSGAYRLHAYAPGATNRGWRVATEADVTKTLLGWKGITSVVTVILKGEEQNGIQDHPVSVQGNRRGHGGGRGGG